MAYKIEFDKDNCRGCGACMMCENWKRSDEGNIYPEKTELEEIGCNEEAADICPADVITIKKI